MNRVRAPGSSSGNSATPAHPLRPLRLLQVLGCAGRLGGERAGITGVERVVELLLDGLDSHRFEHYVVYPQDGELLRRFRESAREVVPSMPRRHYDAGFVRRIEQLLREHHIDLVVSHGYRFDFLTGLATQRARVPHVVSRAVALADETIPSPRKALFGLVDAWTLRRCDGIIAVSEASKRRMQRTQGLPEDKIEVIPNGVRLPEVTPEERRAARLALGIDATVPIVGGIGQLIPRKSFDVLVRALATPVVRRTRAQCVVLGEGPERPRLAALAKEIGVPLLLPGYLPHPYPTLAAFDVAVLPSRAEGMPLAVLESMALGIATVATPVGGTPELITDGQTGLLAPPGDATALGAAIARLLEDVQLRQNLGAAGARHVTERYSLEAMLRAFDVYLYRMAGWSAP